jgi:hypothetical protein
MARWSSENRVEPDAKRSVTRRNTSARRADVFARNERFKLVD